MPIDPYAALHALLRAEAVRNAPDPGPTTKAPGPSPAQMEEAEQQEERPEQKHDR